jgi:hypothetical protein
MAKRNPNRTRQVSPARTAVSEPQTIENKSRISGKWLTFFGVIIVAIPSYLVFFKPSDKLPDAKNNVIKSAKVSSNLPDSGIIIKPTNTGKGTQINPVNIGGSPQIIQTAPNSKTTIDMSKKTYNQSHETDSSNPIINISNEESASVNEINGDFFLNIPLKNYGQMKAINIGTPMYIVKVKNGTHNEVKDRFIKVKDVAPELNPGVTITHASVLSRQELKDTLDFVFYIEYHDKKNKNYKSELQYIEYLPGYFQKPLPVFNLNPDNQIYKFILSKQIKL